MANIKRGKAVISKGPTIEDKMEKLFDKTMHEPFERGDRDRIYPSDAVCPRKCWMLSKTTHKGLHKPSQKILMSYGKMVENLVVEGLTREGHTFVNDYVLPPDSTFNLSGKVDFILEFEGKPWIIELKTTNPLPREARDYQTFQAHCYSAYTCIPNTILLYAKRIVRDGFKFKAFDISPSRQKLFELTTRIFYTQETMKDGLIPPIPAGFKKSKDCKFCPFQNYCWDSGSISALDHFEHMTEKAHRLIWEDSLEKARVYMNEKNQKQRQNRILDEVYSSDSIVNPKP